MRAIAVRSCISGTPFRIKYFEKVLDGIAKHENDAMWTGGQVLDSSQSVI